VVLASDAIKYPKEVMIGEGDLVLDTTLRLDRSSWAAVRAFAQGRPHEAWEPAPVIFAHSSPAYFLAGNTPVLVAASLEDLLVKTNTLIAHTARIAGFKQERDREETLALYRTARDLLASRLALARAAR